MYDFYQSWKRPRDIKRVGHCEIFEEGGDKRLTRCTGIDIKWCEGKYGHAWICGKHRKQLYEDKVRSLPFKGYGTLHIQTFVPVEARYSL